MSISNHVKSVGRIGPLAFESLGYEEKIQRLDLDALRSFQQMLLEGYRQGGLAKALEPSEEQMAALAYNAAGAVETWLLEHPEWFADPGGAEPSPGTGPQGKQ